MCERIEVSIIIPVYNEEKQISHCLDSIQCQEYKNYEVIIVDDGSIDKTGEICDSYAKKDSRFKVIHEANGGVSVARNKGIDVATGKLLMFVDSDDFVKPDFINNYVKMQSESDADVIIGGIALEEKGKSIVNKVPSLKERDEDTIWDNICVNQEIYGYIPAKIYKTDIIKKNSIRFNTKMYSQEDLNFNLSVYEQCKKIILTDYIGYVYNFVPGKRKPPIDHFIENQLKLYRIAKAKKISEKSENIIQNKICSLIFTYFYLQNTSKDFQSAVNKINSVSGLKVFLMEHIPTGEQKRIIKWYILKKYTRIYIYLYCRKLIKKIMGRPIAE